MRAGPDRVLAQVVQVFGAARPHHAYLFANHRGSRLNVLVHDGIGLWLLARRLNEGRFHWPTGEATLRLSRTQFDALVPKPPASSPSNGTSGASGSVVIARP